MTATAPAPTFAERIRAELTDVGGRPFIKNPLAFFSDTKATRTMLTVCDSDSWKADLLLAEKLFGPIYISACYDGFEKDLQTHKDILKQRLKYPGVQDNEEYMRTAKIWILPTKVHTAPPPSELIQSISSNLPDKNLVLSFVKVELSDGKERAFLYKMIDDGQLPSLLCIRWSNDVDDHYPTAFCAGHLTNLGYAHLRTTNGYSLYYNTDNCIYDTVSFKETYIDNPMIQQIVNALANTDIKGTAEPVSDADHT